MAKHQSATSFSNVYYCLLLRLFVVLVFVGVAAVCCCSFCCCCCCCCWSVCDTMTFSEIKRAMSESEFSSRCCCCCCHCSCCHFFCPVVMCVMFATTTKTTTATTAATPASQHLVVIVVSLVFVCVFRLSCDSQLSFHLSVSRKGKRRQTDRRTGHWGSGRERGLRGRVGSTGVRAGKRTNDPTSVNDTEREFRA